MFDANFSATYYHPNIAHIRKKNPIFGNNVNIAKALHEEMGEQRTTEFSEKTKIILNIV